MKLGEFELLPVIDGEVRADPSRAYRGTTPEQWELHRDLLEPDGMLVLVLGGFLVRGGPEDRLVLIDLGLGRQTLFRQQAGGRMIDGLAALGVKPEQITDVLFSHLHFDHVGWASDDGKPVFPN